MEFLFFFSSLLHLQYKLFFAIKVNPWAKLDHLSSEWPLPSTKLSEPVFSDMSAAIWLLTQNGGNVFV